MRFEKNTSDNYTTIKILDGKIDTRRAADLKSEFVLLNSEGAKNIILDMSEVDYADSSGLSAILTGNRLCKTSGGILVLCCLSNHVEKLIKISQLDTVLNILPTEDESREAVFMFVLENEIKGAV